MRSFQVPACLHPFVLLYPSQIPRVSNGVALFSFYELCEVPLGAADYFGLCSELGTPCSLSLCAGVQSCAVIELLFCKGVVGISPRRVNLSSVNVVIFQCCTPALPKACQMEQMMGLLC